MTLLHPGPFPPQNPPWHQWKKIQIILNSSDWQNTTCHASPSGCQTQQYRPPSVCMSPNNCTITSTSNSWSTEALSHRSNRWNSCTSLQLRRLRSKRHHVVRAVAEAVEQLQSSEGESRIENIVTLRVSPYLRSFLVSTASPLSSELRTFVFSCSLLSSSSTEAWL